MLATLVRVFVKNTRNMSCFVDVCMRTGLYNSVVCSFVGNIVYNGQVIFRNIYKTAHMHLTIINEKEATDVKESKEEYLGEFGVRKQKT